jgi:hypothetical protein
MGRAIPAGTTPPRSLSNRRFRVLRGDMDRCFFTDNVRYRDGEADATCRAPHYTP